MMMVSKQVQIVLRLDIILRLMYQCRYQECVLLPWWQASGT